MGTENAPCCGEERLHEERIAAVERELPEDEVLYDLAELFKMFADSTRVKILYALLEAELCVCDIAVLLGLTQSAISHRLQTVKKKLKKLLG